ncbi:hypothetical protein M3Y99_01734100 [Aphelenchoides fujianensis]|nr:hypothetical protein M3Y99_01734100 [Aphelenchoides fujianensis]
MSGPNEEEHLDALEGVVDEDIGDPMCGSNDLQLGDLSDLDDSTDEQPEGDLSLASSISFPARRMDKTLSVIDEESRSASNTRSGSPDSNTSTSSTLKALEDQEKFELPNEGELPDEDGLPNDSEHEHVDVDAISSASSPYSIACSSSLNMSKVRRKLESLPLVERMDLGKIMASLNLKNRPSKEENTVSSAVSNSSVPGGQKEPTPLQPAVQAIALAADENQPSPSTPRRKSSPRSAKELKASMKQREVESHKAGKALIERHINGQLRPPGHQTPSRQTPLKSLQNSQLGAHSRQQSFEKTLVRTAVSSSSFARTDTNDNLSIASTTTGNEGTTLEVSPGTLAFGFVDLKERHRAQVTIRNLTDHSVRVEPILKGGADVFELEDTCTFTISPHSSHALKVYFTPAARRTYCGHIDLKLIGREGSVYRVGLLGYGERAALTFSSNVSHRMEKIEHGKNEVGVCWVDRNLTGFRFVMKNSASRTAFAYLRFVDESGNLVPEEFASISASRVLVMGGGTRAVDMHFPYGMISLHSQNTRSHSSLSNASTRTTRTIAGETLTRLEVVWGEERQRQRLKTYFTYGGGEYKEIQGIDFTREEFADEGREAERKVTSAADVDAFEASLRWTSIQFFDDHVPAANPRALPARPAAPPVGKSNGTFALSMRTLHENTNLPDGRADDTMSRTKSVNAAVARETTANERKDDGVQMVRLAISMLSYLSGHSLLFFLYILLPSVDAHGHWLSEDLTNGTRMFEQRARPHIRLWPADPLTQAMLVFVVVFFLFWVVLFFVYLIIAFLWPDYLTKFTSHHQQNRENTPMNNVCEILLYWCYCCFICGLNMLLILAALKVAFLFGSGDEGVRAERKRSEEAEMNA